MEMAGTCPANGHDQASTVSLRWAPSRKKRGRTLGTWPKFVKEEEVAFKTWNKLSWLAQD